MLAGVTGGGDLAFLNDSAGNDLFVVTDTYASMTGGLPGSPFDLTVNNFRYVHGYGRAGGLDTAELYGTADRDVVATRTRDVKLIGTGHYGRAWYFDRVLVDGFGGDDGAVMYDADPQAGFTPVDPSAPDLGKYYWLFNLEDYTVVNQPAQGGTTHFDAVDAVYSAYWD